MKILVGYPVRLRLGRSLIAYDYSIFNRIVHINKRILSIKMRVSFLTCGEYFQNISSNKRTGIFMIKNESGFADILKPLFSIN